MAAGLGSWEILYYVHTNQKLCTEKRGVFSFWEGRASPRFVSCDAGTAGVGVGGMGWG